MDKTSKIVSSGSRTRSQRITPEDFVILIIHNDSSVQESLIELMKEGHFGVHADAGNGAIGSSLMFTPNIVIFDWNDDAENCVKTLDFVRHQKLARHISQTKFIIVATESTEDKEELLALGNDSDIIIIVYPEKMSYRSTLKKHILRIFLRTQKELVNNANKKMSEAEAASHQHRTASLNELLNNRKIFNEAVIRNFRLLIKQVSAGDPQKIFDLIAETFESLNRTFILSYESKSTNFEYTFNSDQNVQKLSELLAKTKLLHQSGEQINKLNSDQDRRCFFGDEHLLYFCTDSPEVFDELDNFSTVTENFEMFLIQAEQRQYQQELLEEFKIVFDDLYAQMESFEWSDALEGTRDLVTKMFNIEKHGKNGDVETDASGTTELF